MALFTFGCNTANDLYITFTEDSLEVILDKEANLPITTNIQDKDEIKYIFSDNDAVTTYEDTFIFTKIGDVTGTAICQKNNKIFDTIVIHVKTLKEQLIY